MENVRAEAVRGGYRLIDLGELRGRLEREPGRTVLVDTWQDWEYRTGQGDLRPAVGEEVVVRDVRDVHGRHALEFPPEEIAEPAAARCL